MAIAGVTEERQGFAADTGAGHPGSCKKGLQPRVAGDEGEISLIEILGPQIVPGQQRCDRLGHLLKFDRLRPLHREVNVGNGAGVEKNAALGQRLSVLIVICLIDTDDKVGR